MLSSIVRSTTYDYANPSRDLNYSSFIVFYNNVSSILFVEEFRRTVTNVGEGRTSYNVLVTAPHGFEGLVSPEKLELRAKYEKQSYNVIIRYTSDAVNNV